MHTAPIGAIHNQYLAPPPPTEPAVLATGIAATSFDASPSGTSGGGSARNCRSSASRLRRGSGSGRTPFVTLHPAFPSPVATCRAPHVYATSTFPTARRPPRPSPHSSAPASNAVRQRP